MCTANNHRLKDIHAEELPFLLSKLAPAHLAGCVRAGGGGGEGDGSNKRLAADPGEGGGDKPVAAPAPAMPAKVSQ